LRSRRSFLPGASAQDSEEFSRNQRYWANAEQAAQLLCLSCDMNAVDVLSRVRAEALVIHRRKDRAIPLEAGQRLAAELPRARLITLDGDMHLPWVDGDTIVDTIHSFLAGEEIPAANASARPSGCRLDEANREIILNDQRRPTTPLEYAVMVALIRSSGRVVTRDEMLAEIWNTPVAGSNKVDAVVGSLRKKLGPFAASIETVTGHGYRFRGWKKAVNDVP
jgi:DNA-binding response OmpR family regulator